MATPLTDKITALTTAVNETTGASDTTLSAAVATLVAGYGSGGGVDFDEIATKEFSNTDVTLDSATAIAAYAFNNTNITSINAPLVTTIGAAAFDSCTSLSSVSFPNVTTLTGGSQFQNNTSLTEVRLPNLTSNISGSSNFRNMSTSLSVIDCGFTPKLNGSYIFYGSYNADIVLRSTTLVGLSANNTLQPSGTSTLNFYVPEALITVYGSDSAWTSAINAYSNLTVTFNSLEESAYA